MRKISIIGIILPLSLLFAGLLLLKNNQTLKTPSKEELILQEIVTTIPDFTYNNKPIIEISSVTEPENNWHIAIIKSVTPVDKIVPVKIILLEKDDKFRVIAGPDTYFSESEMLALNLPDSVILEIRKL